MTSGQGGETLDRIAIIGGGTAGWMTAIALAMQLDSSTEIVLIESDEIGTIGVGEATIPSIRQFNQLVGIDETEMLRACEGTIKLGIEFDGWGYDGNRYFHAFGGFGVPHRGVSGFDMWRRARGMDAPGSLDDINIAARLASVGKFIPPDPDPSSPLANFDYAYHFDAGLYARFLRSKAEARGVRRIEGKITEVLLSGAEGDVEGVRLANGLIETADFFVDCSGFRGLVIEGALKTGFVDWSDLLPVDRAWAVPSERTGRLLPYTRSVARDAGWQWRIPLQHRTGNGHVFCSSFVSEEQALNELLVNVDGKILKDPMLIHFQTGRRRRFWNRNCVAIGLSGGFIEPLESTAIGFIQSGILRLLKLLPTKRHEEALALEYDRQMISDMENVRDFIILHYALSSQKRGAFWQAMGEIKLPDSLAARIDLFKANGFVRHSADEPYLPLSWISIYHGSGLVPLADAPAARLLDAAELSEVLGRQARFVERVCELSKSHEEFIEQYCRSSATLNFPVIAARQEADNDGKHPLRQEVC